MPWTSLIRFAVTARARFALNRPHIERRNFAPFDFIQANLNLLPQLFATDPRYILSLTEPSDQFSALLRR